MLFFRRIIHHTKNYCTKINDKTFEKDSFTNVTPKLLSHINKNLHSRKDHPLCFIKERIIQFFHDKCKGKRGNPLFSVYEDLSPVVSTEQNFDNLLIPPNHPSRSKSDCYYLNKNWMLRSHMTAHQRDLLTMGLSNFLMVGDVYRRDDINATHYTVFHQLDGVRLFTPEELFTEIDDGKAPLVIKETNQVQRTNEKQETYTSAASSLVESNLKSVLEDLSKDLFGSKVKYKWVEAFFPFTHPSWELEVQLEDQWIELLGCGVIENKILKKAGCGDRIGWAFGIGLERLAMIHYSIPDIRIFWSEDPAFHNQFKGKSCRDSITFKPFSAHPPCLFDISFWINDDFESNDFYEFVREHWSDIIEEVKLLDSFKCEKTNRASRCFRIVYRSMEKTLKKSEVADIHKDLEQRCVEKFKVVIR